MLEEEKVRTTIEAIRPAIQADGGDIFQHARALLWWTASMVAQGCAATQPHHRQPLVPDLCSRRLASYDARTMSGTRVR